jgi:hypothetical protein
MNTAENCMRFAEQCEIAASKAAAPKQRETMRAIARVWREIALERERKLRSGKAA